MAIDLSPTTQDALSLIVQNYNQGLDPALHLDDTDFVFNAPMVNPDVAYARNTRLYAKPTAISGKYGRVTIYYNRIDLTAIGAKPIITRGAATMMADIVPLLNDFYGINLVATDYNNVALPAQGGGLTQAILTATVGSLMFIGTLDFDLEAGATPAIRAA